MSIQAKFRCTSKTQHIGDVVDVRLEACTSGEGNKSWSRYTPSGEMRLSITNPGAHEQFVPGNEYLIEFTPV